MGFVRAFEYLAAAFLLGRAIRFERASFTEVPPFSERKEERTFHGEGSREILAKSFAASFEAAYEIRAIRSLSGPDRSNDLNIAEETRSLPAESPRLSSREIIASAQLLEIIELLRAILLMPNTSRIFLVTFHSFVLSYVQE